MELVYGLFLSESESEEKKKKRRKREERKGDRAPYIGKYLREASIRDDMIYSRQHCISTTAWDIRDMQNYRAEYNTEYSTQQQTPERKKSSPIHCL